MACAARVLDLPDKSPTPVFELPLADPPGSVNRRFVPRVRHRFQVRLRDGDELYEGLDLSFGGLMCTGDELVWPGNTVAFDLLLPDEPKAVRLAGRVLDLVSHRGRTAMRIRFDDVSAARRKRIAIWMARQVGHAGSPSSI